MSETTETPWGHIILGSLLVQIVAFSGVALSAVLHVWQQHLRAKKDKSSTSPLRADSVIFRILIPSFATGAIAATAFYLLIPESIHSFLLATSSDGDHDDHRYLSEQDHDEHIGHDDDVDQDEHTAHEEHSGHDDHHDESFVWKFGTCVLSGFIFPAMLSVAFGKNCNGTALPSGNGSSTTSTCSTTKKDEKNDANINLATVEDGGCEECSICNNDEGGWKEEEEDQQASSSKTTAKQISFGDVDFHLDSFDEEDGGCDDCSLCDDVGDIQASTSSTTLNQKTDKNWTLVFTTLFGDFLCNFTDGIFIGTAFTLCNQSTGYSIVATTIYHEIAQEISDYTILTQECNFTPVQALASNFAVGTAVLLGAIIVATLNVSNTAVGCILALAAGVYLYLCGVELLTKIINSRRSVKESVAFFAFVALGAVPIGVVLLNHGHCE